MSNRESDRRISVGEPLGRGDCVTVALPQKYEIEQDYPKRISTLVNDAIGADAAKRFYQAAFHVSEFATNLHQDPAASAKSLCVMRALLLAASVAESFPKIDRDTAYGLAAKIDSRVPLFRGHEPLAQDPSETERQLVKLRWGDLALPTVRHRVPRRQVTSKSSDISREPSVRHESDETGFSASLDLKIRAAQNFRYHIVAGAVGLVSILGLYLSLSQSSKMAAPLLWLDLATEGSAVIASIAVVISLHFHRSYRSYLKQAESVDAGTGNQA